MIGPQDMVVYSEGPQIGEFCLVMKLFFFISIPEKLGWRWLMECVSVSLVDLSVEESVINGHTPSRFNLLLRPILEITLLLSGSILCVSTLVSKITKTVTIQIIIYL